MTLAADAERVAALALAEDGSHDLTSETCIPADATGTARIEYRRAGVVAGGPYADAVARQVGLPAIEWLHGEGARLDGPSVIARLDGNLRAILRAERPLLNLLQRASGIATATRAFVDRVAGTRAVVLHTRKTAPGLRQLDVSAVIAGGGQTHRLDLAHEIMIKDNHWRSLERSGQSLAGTIEAARQLGALACYVEVESIPQLETACAAGADRLLVDNQPPEVVAAWTLLARKLSPAIQVEATGGITLDNVRAFAEAGVDFISIGALTHSVSAADLALEVE